MLHRNSALTLLLLSGAVSVAGTIAFSQSLTERTYVSGSTTEYHPPAEGDRAAASRALDEAGFTRTAQPTADIFSPTFVGQEPVAIGARLSHSVVDAREETTLHAAVAILGQEDGVKDRAPLNLALVIDRSGSMVGEKLDHAKAASHALIDALQPTDRLSIVTYGADVTTEHGAVFVDANAKESLHTAVRSITAYGSTNLSGGLERARPLVLSGRADNTINRIVLLSDGRANMGITDHVELSRLASDAMESGISLSTMGVGLDYDEDLMAAIARSGAGNYHFIEDGAATEQVFQDELSQLQSAVARNVRLHVRLGDHVELVEVHGFDADRTRDGFAVSLGAFTASQRKDLLIELRVRPSSAGEFTAFKSELSYVDVLTDRELRRSQPLKLMATPGTRKLNPPVAKRVQQIRTLESFQTAMQLYDGGDRFAAADLLEQQQQANRDFLKDLGVDDPAFRRVDGELGDLAEALRKTDRHTTEGKWIVKSKKKWANDAVQDQVIF